LGGETRDNQGVRVKAHETSEKEKHPFWRSYGDHEIVEIYIQQNHL